MAAVKFQEYSLWCVYEAKDAIGLYKNRDASEKVFRAYKLYLELLQQKTKNKKAPKPISRKRKSIQN